MNLEFLMHGARRWPAFWLLGFILGPMVGPAAEAGPVVLVVRAPDPNGSPRPTRDARDVPPRTSLYFELAAAGKKSREGPEVAPESVAVALQAEGGEAVDLLRPGRRFAEGASGRLTTKSEFSGARSLAVYIEPGQALKLKPSTTYTVRVSAGLKPSAAKAAKTTNANGPDVRSEDAGSWTFTTAAAGGARAVDFSVDLATPPVRWHGRFFSGLCDVVFCTRAAEYGPTYELMAEARKQHPRAWSYQRDFWPTGFEYRPPGFLPQWLPNIVRERETRRIAALKNNDAGATVLQVEDFFGHEQYDIPSGRSVAEDYRPGDEVLIADGVHDARTKVVAVDGSAGTVTVEAVAPPDGGWKIRYDRPLPTKENSDAPGLFPPGGCYLRKFAPSGTPCYYWGRLDKEWDMAHRKFGRRLMVNFADATGDLSRDGRSWTTFKDPVEWHEAARAITGHLIDRYGEDALQFTWSVFNEPDLGALFWRADWNELQTFYDYTVDAVLRAFEDRGLDSKKVFIGGLELGGIFGTHLKLSEFLAHCSPRAEAKAPGALPKNAAMADHRLDGKRSRRVEELCRTHQGKGSPCDFISIHSYNRSEMMAAKLASAKETALKIDPDFYRELWVNSHESCPDWMPPPDEAARDVYHGNGYFPTWCVDVVRRQLARAASDPRHAYGETILTVWPPPSNFTGLNAITRNVRCDDDGDGRSDRTVTIAMPVFHALGLLSDMGEDYWALPERAVAGSIVSGFASRDKQGVVRVLVYAHNAHDTQSRSEAAFDVSLDLGLGGPDRPGAVRVQEHRFDRAHNSPYPKIRELLDRAGPNAAAYPAAEVEAVQKLCECHPTAESTQRPDADGHLRLKVHVETNGCDFVTVRPGQ